MRILGESVEAAAKGNGAVACNRSAKAAWYTVHLHAFGPVFRHARAHMHVSGILTILR